VDDSGNVTKNGQEDVDEEVCTAATLKENANGREEDGKNDLDDVAIRLSVICVGCNSSRVVVRKRGRGLEEHSRSGERHCDCGLMCVKTESLLRMCVCVYVCGMEMCLEVDELLDCGRW